jgi:hypothetical protein
MLIMSKMTTKAATKNGNGVKKLPVPPPSAKQQALSAAPEKAPLDPSDPGDLPEFLRRKPGEKSQPTTTATPVRYVDPKEKHQQELRDAQKKTASDRAATKRAVKKERAAAETVGKTTTLPLTGKAALRAISEAAVAKSDVTPTKVPPGMTGEKAKRAAERAKKAAKSAKKPAKAAKPARLPTPRDAEEAERVNKVLRLSPRKPGQGKRSMYDWKGEKEAAAKGKIPSPPDFSANTHRVYRPALAEVVELVQKKDLDGLLKHRVEGTCSSPKAIKRYREIALIALKAKQAQ